MKSLFSRTAAIALCAAWMLAGCSQQGAVPASGVASPQASAESADAARNLDTYRQLLRIRNDEMAVTLGKDIVSRYPDSDIDSDTAVEVC